MSQHHKRHRQQHDREGQQEAGEGILQDQHKAQNGVVGVNKLRIGRQTGFPIDPLAELDIDIQSFDIPRIVSVYPDRAGVRWWTKAWFNNREEGEASVEIEREQAIRFIHDNIEKDAWLEEFFPKQMEVYHNAIEQTKEQLLKQINMI